MEISKPIKAVRAAVEVLIFSLGVCGAAFGLEVPPLKARVNDYAAVLAPATERQLENSLAAFEDAESTQIVVLTIPELEGEPIEGFAIRVAEQWKIGQKGLDNGAILLIAVNDRKLRIEVGYGLEGKLTDLTAGRIIQEVIVPQFRAGRFDQGVINGVNAMMEVVKGEFKVPAKKARPSGQGSFGMSFMVMLVIYAVLVLNIGRISRTAGTVAGGVMLPIFGAMSLTGSLLLLAGLIPVGFLLGYILSRVGAGMGTGALGRRGRSKGGFWTGSRGGFSSGGFGGFSGGGGGFGGGGASGGW